MKEYFYDLFSSFTSLQWGVLCLFIFLLLIRWLYLFFFTGKILFRKDKEKKFSDEGKESFSVLIVFRNEEENIRNNLPRLLGIEDGEPEFVAVDDFSQDQSFSILGLLKERHKNLKVSSLNQETGYSTKLAHNIGLKAVKNKWVLMLPVTASEVPESWYEKIREKLSESADTVIAYSNVLADKGIFNHLYRIERHLQQLKSYAYISNGLPLVYDEENIAFRKSKYFEMGGYGQKISEPYANLELLLNSFIKKGRTEILFGGETAVRNELTVSRADYEDLLKKSFRIEKNLKWRSRVVLMLDEWTRMLLLPVVIVLIVLVPALWAEVLILLFLKIFSGLLIVKTSQKRLNEPKIFLSSLIYDVLIPYLKVFYRWNFNRQRKKHKWRSKV